MTSESENGKTGAFSPSATRALLESLGHRPRKPLGGHDEASLHPDGFARTDDLVAVTGHTSLRSGDRVEVRR